MKINEFEAAVLDTLLEALAEQKQLNQQQLLELFDGDETFAAAMVRLLTEAELIEPDGYTADSELPERVIADAGALTFLLQGGFSAPFQQADQSAAVTNPVREIPFEVEMPATVEEIQNPARPVAYVEDITFESEPAPDTAVQQSVLPPMDNYEKLQAEVQHLRSQERLMDHRLREKDILIESLKSTNNQLLKLRIFIWVLLGMIALLVLWSMFHK